jgi:hypothetical protein
MTLKKIFNYQLDEKLSLNKYNGTFSSNMCKFLLLVRAYVYKT